MGRYLNPYNEGFAESVRSKIYVDKTGLIACTNDCLSTEQKFICVSRPRRFGKSMALKMLAAYYSCGCDSRDLFQGLKIEEDPAFGEHLNQYDVIYLDIARFLTGAKGVPVTECIEKKVLEEVYDEYGGILSSNVTGLEDALGRLYEKNRRKFIFLIDVLDKSF